MSILILLDSSKFNLRNTTLFQNLYNYAKLHLFLQSLGHKINLKQ